MDSEKADDNAANRKRTTIRNRTIILRWIALLYIKGASCRRIIQLELSGKVRKRSTANGSSNGWLDRREKWLQGQTETKRRYKVIHSSCDKRHRRSKRLRSLLAIYLPTASYVETTVWTHGNVKEGRGSVETKWVWSEKVGESLRQAMMCTKSTQSRTKLERDAGEVGKYDRTTVVMMIDMDIAKRLC